MALRRVIVTLTPSVLWVLLWLLYQLAAEIVFGSAADWLKGHSGVVGDFLAWRWSVIIITMALLAATGLLMLSWESLISPSIKRLRKRSGELAFNEAPGRSAMLTTGVLTTKKIPRLDLLVTVSDFVGYRSNAGHVWVIHGLTITNKTDRHVNLDAKFELADRQVNAINHVVDMTQRPVAAVEERLKVPLKIDAEDSIRGTLVAESKQLDDETRQRMIQGPWSLVLQDRLSNKLHKEVLPPVAQVITAQLPKFPQPRRGVAKWWYKVRSNLPWPLNQLGIR